MQVWKVAILVDNLEDAIDFYTNVLDMKIIKRKARSVHLDAGNIRLELISREVYKDDPNLSNLGVHHLSFVVSDIEKETARLKNKGAKFIWEPTDRGNGLKIAFFVGPTNVNLQLYDQKSELEK